MDASNAPTAERLHPAAVQGSRPAHVCLLPRVSCQYARHHHPVFPCVPCPPRQVIKLSKELPVVVEYKVADFGYVRYYLAPKVGVPGGGSAWWWPL